MWLAVAGVLLAAIALLPGTAIEQAFGRKMFDALDSALETFIRAQGKPVQQVALPAASTTRRHADVE